MVDYTSESSNFYLNTVFRPIPKLTLNGSVIYNLSKSDMDEVDMPDVTAEVSGDLSHQDFTFTHLHTYSDLEYKLLQFGIGLEYQIQKGFSYTAQVDYADLTDEKGWVFGDESGSLMMIRSGVQLTF